MIGRAMSAVRFQGGLTMVAQWEPKHMTVDEWRELERTSHDIKHEYIDGHAYAMSGGSLAHGRIGLNACLALENALLASNKPCFVYNSDVATRLCWLLVASDRQIRPLRTPNQVSCSLLIPKRK